MANVKGGSFIKSAVNKIINKLGAEKTVQVGFMPDKTYPDGTLVASVAAFQEFGTKSIPPRPFFRNMVAKEKGGWPAMMASNLKHNDYNAKISLAQTGSVMVSQLKQSIIDTNEPPLSPITLMLRKMRRKNPDLLVTGATVGEAARRVAAGESYSGVSTKPLIDTAVMINSVDLRVT